MVQLRLAAALVEVSRGWFAQHSPVIVDAVHVSREPMGVALAQSISLTGKIYDAPVYLADKRIHVVRPCMLTAREVGPAVGVTRGVFDPRADHLEIE